MKRLHAHAKSFFARNKQTPRAFGVLFIAAFLLLAANASGPSHSVEVGYSALSPAGIEGGQIVPASCGSQNNSPLFGQACSAYNSCGQANGGTYDECGNCTATPPSEAACPTCSSVGALGTYPNCYYAPVTPPPACPSGTTGTYPDCGNCNPATQVGTYPNCTTITCSSVGALGTYPNCSWPPGPTCASVGALGAYPNCYYMCPNGINTTIWSDYHDCPSSTPPPPACTSTGVYCQTPPNACGLYWAGTMDTCGNCSVGTSPRSNADCGSSPPSPSPSGGGGGAPSISANPTSVQAGAVTTITWSCPAPNSSASGVNFSTGGAASGSVQVTVSANTTYTVVCGQTGTQANVQVTTINSTLSLVAAPSRVQSGNTSTLTWSASNVLSCTLTGPGVSASANAVSGSVSTRQNTTPGITGQSIYTLTCQTSGSPVSTSVQVNVIPTEQEI